MPDVITRILVDDTRRIRANIPLSPDPETLEYRFRINFAAGREIAMGSRRVSIFVQFEGDEPGDFPVTTTLFRPDGTIAAGPMVLENRPDPSLPVPPSGGGSFLFALNTGGGPFDFNGSLVVGPGDPQPPPPEVDRLEFEITPETDPNGVWRVTLTNTGISDGIFRILISHPGAQMQLRTSTIPIELIDRMFKKMVLLAEPALRIDRQAMVTFSREFEDLTGLGTQVFGEDLRARDINLEGFQLGFTGDGGTATVNVRLSFETEGAEEIAVENLDDIDFTQLDFDLAIGLGNSFSSLDTIVANRRPVLEQRLDFAGNHLDELAGQVSLDFDLDVQAEASANFTTDFFADLVEDVDIDNIDDYILHSFLAVVRNQAVQEKLHIAAEHITDSIMFLATGSRRQLFFDIGIEGSNVVVTHYRRPTVQDLILPHLSDGPQVVTGALSSGSSAGRGTSSPGSGGVLSGGLLGSTTLAAPPTGLVATDASVGTTGGLERALDHIVVLMMENRSFDHMLGYLRLEKGRDDIDGLTGPTVNTNPVPGSQTPQGIHRLDDPIIIIDPDHSHPGTLLQVANGAMSGFVESYLGRDPRPGDEDLVMGFYNNSVVSVFDQLAEEYRICDRWFCSHPGPTFPNRFISLSGSTPSINNIELTGDLAGAVETDTIFDVLTQHGVSWKYVESNIAFLRMFDRYRVDDENIIQRGTFAEMVRAGQLPAVTWIDPNFGELEIDEDKNDDHPPADIRKGQGLVAEIYELLTSNPDQWRKTLFIITYDEHGGFYDHVPPHGLSGSTEPTVHKIHPDGEEFYGCRVPAFLISPLVERRSVTSNIYDHTSILKTILLNFIGAEATTQELLGRRVDAANDLLGELLATPRLDVATIASPAETTTAAANSLANRPIENDSFHLGMRLFPFGPKLKDIIAGRS